MSEGLHLHIHMIKGMNLNTNPFLRDTIIIVTLIHFFDTIIINIRLRVRLENFCLFKLRNHTLILSFSCAMKIHSLNEKSKSLPKLKER